MGLTLFTAHFYCRKFSSTKLYNTATISRQALFNTLLQGRRNPYEKKFDLHSP